jgi:hypothetical protein
MPYLLDANVFIQAKNLHYGLDFCPAFWDWLIAYNDARHVFSIEKVADEIAAGADDLSAWAAQRGPGFFLAPEAAILPALGRVSAWATGQAYDPAAVSTFLQVADYYLVGHALCAGAHACHPRAGLTLDKKNKNSQRLHRARGKIHDAVRDARTERARFVLGLPQP